MNWNYPNQYIPTPSWSPYHQNGQFDHQGIDPSFTGNDIDISEAKYLEWIFVREFFFNPGAIFRIISWVLNNTVPDVSTDPRLIADFNHQLERNGLSSYQPSALPPHSVLPSPHETHHPLDHHVTAASVGVRPLNGSLEDKEIEDDPKMKIYPWMRRMHASQNKRGNDKSNFVPPIQYIQVITDHTESSHAPRQGQPTESKRIRTAYTRHQTLELGKSNSHHLY